MLFRDATYEQAVTAWTAHLRAGGTTEWSAWRDTATDRPQGVDRPRVLPDAIHLELVRRINLAAPGAGNLRGLADLVLATAAPGRGLVDVPLPWPDASPRFGTPPMEPVQLPEEELIRLAVGVLAHLLPDVPRSTPEVLPDPWPLPWRRRFRLHGSPGTVAGVRRHLLAQGLVETDWRPRHIVIARPLPVMMAEWWAASVRGGGILKWSTAWRRAEAAGRLPPVTDVTGIIDNLATGNVHVVVASGAQETAAIAAEVAGAPPAEMQVSGDPAVSDLLRRLNRLTALTHGRGGVSELARTLAATLDEVATPAYAVTSLAPPPTSMAWAREQAAATTRAIHAAGYAVHGELDALTPTDHRLPGTVDRGRTLELAVTACLRSWHLRGNP